MKVKIVNVTTMKTSKKLGKKHIITTASEDWSNLLIIGKLVISNVDIVKSKQMRSVYPRTLRNKIILAVPLSTGNAVVGLTTDNCVFYYCIQSKKYEFIPVPSVCNATIPSNGKKKTTILKTISSLVFDISVSSESETLTENLSGRIKISASASGKFILLANSSYQVLLFVCYDNVSQQHQTNDKGCWYNVTKCSPNTERDFEDIDVGFLENKLLGVKPRISVVTCKENVWTLSTMVVNNLCVTSSWKQKKISQDNDNFMISRGRKAVLVRWCSSIDLICICLNGLARKIKILFLSHESEYIIETILPAVRPKSSLSRVTSIQWNSTDLFVVGCLSSGHIFVVSRLGQLLQLSYKSPGIQSSFFSNVDTRKKTPKSVKALNPQQIHVFSHWVPNLIIVSSNNHLSILKLSVKCQSDIQMASSFLRYAHRWKNRLKSYLNEHEYDFICGSNRLLARSLGELPKSQIDIPLWTLEQEVTNTPVWTKPTILEQNIKTVFDCLLSSWNILITTSIHTKPIRKLISTNIKENIDLFKSLLVSGSTGDFYEYQARLLQCARMFHQFFIVPIMAHKISIVRQLVNFTKKFIKISINTANEMSWDRKLDTFTILSQTLILSTSSMTKLTDAIKVESIWMLLYRNLYHYRAKNNATKKERILMYIIQKHLNIKTPPRRSKYNYFFIGSNLKKCDIISNAINEVHWKKLKSSTQSLLNTLFYEKNWTQLQTFLLWLFKKCNQKWTDFMKRIWLFTMRYISIKCLIVVKEKYMTKFELEVIYSLLAFGNRWKEVSFLAEQQKDFRIAILSHITHVSKSTFKRPHLFIEAIFGIDLTKTGDFNNQIRIIHMYLKWSTMVKCCVIKSCLKKCVNAINDAIKDFPLISKKKIYSPVCTADNNEADDRFLEQRKTIWKRINLALCICQASGIASHLVQHILHTYGHGKIYISSEFQQNLDSITTNDNEIVTDEEDVELQDTFEELTMLIWIFHCHEELNKTLNAWMHSKFNKSKFSDIQDLASKVQSWAYVCFQCQISWRQETLSLMISAAMDSIPTSQFAYRLASAVGKVKVFPSLLQDKLTRLLDRWTKIPDPNYKNLASYFHARLSVAKVEITESKRIINADKTKEFLNVFQNYVSDAFSNSFVYTYQYPILKQYFDQIYSFEISNLKSDIDGVMPIQTLNEIPHSTSTTEFLKGQHDTREHNLYYTLSCTLKEINVSLRQLQDKLLWKDEILLWVMHQNCTKVNSKHSFEIAYPIILNTISSQNSISDMKERSHSSESFQETFQNNYNDEYSNTRTNGQSTESRSEMSSIILTGSPIVSSAWEPFHVKSVPVQSMHEQIDTFTDQDAISNTSSDEMYGISEQKPLDNTLDDFTMSDSSSSDSSKTLDHMKNFPVTQPHISRPQLLKLDSVNNDQEKFDVPNQKWILKKVPIPQSGAGQKIKLLEIPQVPLANTEEIKKDIKLDSLNLFKLKGNQNFSSTVLPKSPEYYKEKTSKEKCQQTSVEDVGKIKSVQFKSVNTVNVEQKTQFQQTEICHNFGKFTQTSLPRMNDTCTQTVQNYEISASNLKRHEVVDTEESFKIQKLKESQKQKTNSEILPMKLKDNAPKKQLFNEKIISETRLNRNPPRIMSPEPQIVSPSRCSSELDISKVPVSSPKECLSSESVKLSHNSETIESYSANFTDGSSISRDSSSKNTDKSFMIPTSDVNKPPSSNSSSAKINQIDSTSSLGQNSNQLKSNTIGSNISPMVEIHHLPDSSLQITSDEAVCPNEIVTKFITGDISIDSTVQLLMKLDLDDLAKVETNPKEELHEIERNIQNTAVGMKHTRTLLEQVDYINKSYFEKELQKSKKIEESCVVGLTNYPSEDSSNLVDWINEMQSFGHLENYNPFNNATDLYPEKLSEADNNIPQLDLPSISDVSDFQSDEKLDDTMSNKSLNRALVRKWMKQKRLERTSRQVSSKVVIDPNHPPLTGRVIRELNTKRAMKRQYLKQLITEKRKASALLLLKECQMQNMTSEKSASSSSSVTNSVLFVKPEVKCDSGSINKDLVALKNIIWKPQMTANRPVITPAAPGTNNKSLIGRNVLNRISEGESENLSSNSSVSW